MNSNQSDKKLKVDSTKLNIDKFVLCNPYGTEAFNLTIDNEFTSTTFSDTHYGRNSVLLETDIDRCIVTLYGSSKDGKGVPTLNFHNTRVDDLLYSPTKLNDRLGQLIFNGNLNQAMGPSSSNVVGGEIRFVATENWQPGKCGTAVGIEATKEGTEENINVFLSSVTETSIKGDTLLLQNSQGEDYISIGPSGIKHKKSVYSGHIVKRVLDFAGTYRPDKGASNYYEITINNAIDINSNHLVLDLSYLASYAEGSTYVFLFVNDSDRNFEIKLKNKQNVSDSITVISAKSKQMINVHCINGHASAIVMPSVV